MFAGHGFPQDRNFHENSPTRLPGGQAVPCQPSYAS